VGGVEAGYILFGGRGNIQAFNCSDFGPEIESLQGYFSIWAKEEGEFNSVEDVEFDPVVRLLEGRIPSEQSGYPSKIPHLAGIPRFRKAGFTGKFPFGSWQLEDRDMPVLAEMEAYNPFIPLDMASSSLPACIIRWKLTNPLQKPVEVSLAFSITVTSSDGTRVEEVSPGGYRGMKLSGTGHSEDLVVVTSPEAGIKIHGQPQIFWRDFADDGQLEPTEPGNMNLSGSPEVHSLFMKMTLSPGGDALIPVIFTWASLKRKDFTDATSIAGNIIRDMDYLESGSRAFSEVIFQSSYPDYLIHSLAGDIVQLKHAEKGRQGFFQEMNNRMFPDQGPVALQHLAGAATDHPENPEKRLVNILRVYNDWRLTGDTTGLKKHWDQLTVQIEQIRGMMPGRDMLSGSLYLAALKACSEMAGKLEAPEMARHYLNLFNESVTLFESECWNGEYFIQSAGGDQPEDHRTGTGCYADQLLGQCLAWSAGLDSLFTTEKIRRAMLSVYRYNFSRNLNNHINAGRGNVLNDEGGLLTCTWPHGNRPVIPVLHADEVWTGIEYTSAAGMIYAGMVDEGLEITRISADRFRGYNRNPWPIHPDGFWSLRPAWHLHLALSGYRFDATEKTMVFHPRINQTEFTCFWSTSTGWGRAYIGAGSVALEVLFGELDVNRITLPASYAYRNVVEISHGMASVNAGRGSIEILLTGSMPLASGIKFSIKLRQ
jgi:hypothetical protein